MDDTSKILRSYLTKYTNANGSVFSETWSVDRANKPIKQTAVLYTALCLDALCCIEYASQEVESWRHTASVWLLEQRSSAGTYNYWPRDSLAAITDKYPDDLDDTACVIAALTHNQSVTPAMLADYVSALTFSEVEPGGPYNTWINQEDRWRDIDLAVNANIAYSLRRYDVVLPGLDDYLQRASQDHIASPYYVSPIAVLYFLARAGVRDISPDAIQLLNDAARDSDDLLNSALAQTTLLRLGRDPKALLPHYINLKSKLQSGKIVNQGMVVERKGSVMQVSGAKLWIVAAIVEAITEFQTASQPKELVLNRKSKEEATDESIYSLVDRRLSHIPRPLSSYSRRYLKKFRVSNGGQEISLLPLKVAECLNSSNSAHIPELGAASVFGWLAYDIYDDILDGEGTTNSLPLANIALRESYRLFCNFFAEEDYEVYVQSIFDRIDAANYWEVSSTRNGFNVIPDYRDLNVLAERSIGHSLVTTAILKGSGLDLATAKKSESFFRPYLIARQLCDDMHDWGEDLAKGHINAVAAIILTDARNAGINFSQEDLTSLNAEFWHNSVVTVLKLIADNLHTAKLSLKAEPLISLGPVLTPLVDRVQSIHSKTVEQRQEMLEFLRTYRG